jgi:hypothetical protein
MIDGCAAKSARMNALVPLGSSITAIVNALSGGKAYGTSVII